MRSRGDLALRGKAGAIGRGKMQVEGGHRGKSWEGFELQTLMPQQLNVGEVDLIAYSKSVLSNSTDSDDGVATMIAQIILLLLAKATGQSPRPSKSVSTIH